ncbi:hypothetical protein F5X68DRAFT_240714 [Plectosphaerella plurivora]|uniref:Extracellular membrane protein CFEM domain-containing protein n=1 Tax=Plectosphaerella plurivora TaxID=936078 RepID=A0A9P8VC69_9PEZI|nr:hypothetical protein F5X68DRAFT_240714 [Plectosphaerella plurivora]
MPSQKPTASVLRVVAFLLALGISPVTANDPVSITVSHIHRCVTSCVYRLGLNTDIGDILRCGTPYLNDCYCPTATPALREVESYATACASEKCEAGDQSHDVSGIKFAYASYCAGAGYNQGLEAWFAPAEATTEPEAPATATQGAADGGAGDVVTTTQLTVVTQTTAGNDADTRSRVVVHATSTLWVDASGATVAAPSGGGGGSNVALGAGVGAGVGVALILVGIFAWLCIRRRRRNRVANNLPPVGGPAPPMVAVSPDQGRARKPVASAEVIPSPSPVSELNGYGQQQELGGKSVTPTPVSPINSPVPVPIQTRMWNSEPHRPELHGQGGGPPPVSPLAPAPIHNRPHEMWNSDPRPELYGQGGSPPPNYHQLANTQRTELP